MDNQIEDYKDMFRFILQNFPYIVAGAVVVYWVAAILVLS